MAQAEKQGGGGGGGGGGPAKKDARGFSFKFRRVLEEPEKRGAKDRPRLLVRYETDVRSQLAEEFGYKNPLMIPTVQKVVLNVGLGQAIQTPRLLEQAFENLGYISGQRPVVTRARTSIANFKLRQGMKIGCMVTLRKTRMWEFLDRLLTVALPRTRDFRGVSKKAFDGRGNYTLGLKDVLIFPEVDFERMEKPPGMSVCIQTSARTNEEGRALLTRLGMPFRTN